MWLLPSCLLILLAVSIPHWLRGLAYKRWHKKRALDQHLSAYIELYATVNGFTLSHAARHTRDAMEYVYGEIDFIPFIALLSLTKPDENTVFYDLGSGTGKAVIACAMVFNVKESHGIELFSSLHHAACNQLQSLSDMTDYSTTIQKIHFTNDHILNSDFHDATLIFINATGFFGEPWVTISQRIEQTTQCATVITTSKPLKSTAYSIIHTTSVQMSWGIVTAYIQQRDALAKTC